MRQDEDALIYKFLHAQLRKPNKNDWGQTVLADLEDLDISKPRIPRESFKNLISEKISVLALNYLNTEKSRHSKVLNLVHRNIKMQDYLSPNDMGIDQAKFLLQLRTRMIEVINNYSGSYPDLRCPLCKSEVDTQQHLLECKKLEKQGEIVSSLINYCNIFNGKLEDKANVARILQAKFRLRQNLLKK